MKNIISILQIVVFGVLTINLNAQNDTSIKQLWQNELKSQKEFIENNGQFPEINGKKILYAYVGNSEKFYFTNKGLIIKMDTLFVKNDLFSWTSVNSTNENEENENLKLKSYFINAEWENSNNDIKIDVNDQTSNYYTFRSSTKKSKGYKKIIYRNVYPNIDIEYTIPTDSSGIKYNIILNTGANVSDIQLKYSGDVDKIIFDDNGNIIIKTPLHNLIEHKPRSYYLDESNEIVSSFYLQNNTISFNISADNKKQVIIDPWVSGINVSGDDYGYNVDYDNNNNLYVYIRAYSVFELFVSKYSPSGTMLWTHIVTTSNQYEGNLMVDRLSNKIYISEGFNGTGAQAYRLDDSGIPDGFISQKLSSFREMWDMTFDIIFNKIIGFGGGTNSNLNGGLINSVTGSVSTANFSGVSGTCQDIVCGATDYDGKLFVIYSQTICGAGQVNNKLELVNTNLNGPVWIAPSGFNTFLEASNHIQPVNAQTSNGFNALAVNDNYLYYYDGKNLAAYNKLNGTLLDSTLVGFMGTMYDSLGQGGIAVDDCDNVYVGGPASNLLVYHFNGTTFSFLSNLKLLWAGDHSVYDIKYDRNTNLLYVSGYNNIGVYISPVSCQMQTCVIDSMVLNDIYCVQNNHYDLNGNIYVNLPQDSIILSISDQSSFITQTISPPFSNPVYFSISDIPISLQPHIITVTISGTIICQYSINYNVPQVLNITSSSVNPTCGNSDGKAIVNITSGGVPPFSYFWSSGTSTIGTSNVSDSIVGIPAGVYCVTITNSNGCSSIQNFNLSDGTLSVNIVQNQISTCNGLCNGIVTADISVSGLIPPYNYEWSNGQSNYSSLSLSDTCTNLCAGLIIVTVSDNNNCHAVNSFNLEQPPALLSTITPIHPSCFGSSNGGAIVNVNDGFSPYTYLWSNGQTTQMAVNLSAGNYSLSVTDSHGCSVTNSFTLSNPPAVIAGYTYLANNLTVQFTNISTAYCYYHWNFGDGTTSTSANPTHIFISEGTYQVCLLVENQCDSLVYCQNITVILSDVNQVDNENILIYPNPVTDKLNIIFPEILKSKVSIKLFDNIGQKVADYSFTNKINEIDLKHFAEGMYYIKVKTDNGIVLNKIVINKN